MGSEILCDNDVVLKSCCYDLSVEFVICLHRLGDIFLLGSAVYVVQNRIERSREISDRLVAKNNLSLFIEEIQVVEPDQHEINLAAHFESEAQTQNLSLDTGESLLLAILILRGAKLLLTGDKRAIRSIEDLGATNESAAKVANCVACLEQMVLSLLKYEEVTKLQSRVCREPRTDVALSNCFSCSSGKFTLETVREGLSSYVSSMRIEASRVLLASNDLQV